MKPTRNFLDETSAAITNTARAMRLSLVDPPLHQFLDAMSLALNLEGRHDEAVAVAEQAIVEPPNHVATWRHLVASYLLAGRLSQTRQALDELVRTAPHTHEFRK